MILSPHLTSRVRALAHLFVIIALGACQGESVKEGTKNATACAESDLIAQCPPNSFPDLESNATIACSLDGSIDASQEGQSFDGEAAIDTACFGAGECRVVCRLEIPCEHGVLQISPTDGIICAQAPACIPDARRCDGPSVQVCSLRGQWDTIDCPAGQTCRYDMMNVGYCALDSSGTAGETAGETSGEVAGERDNDQEFSCQESCIQLFEQCLSVSPWCPQPRPMLFRDVCEPNCEMDDTLVRGFVNGEYTCRSIAEELEINPDEPPEYCQE